MTDILSPGIHNHWYFGSAILSQISDNYYSEMLYEFQNMTTVKSISTIESQSETLL